MDDAYTTKQVLAILGCSRATLYNRGWSDRAVRMFEDGPLLWPRAVVEEIAAEQGIEL
jgi:hypothetical protein